MFLHVDEVIYIKPYKLRLRFSDGLMKDIDLEAELHGEIFQPLKDVKLFKQVYINKDTRTIEWPNGADFAPEFLYENGMLVKKSA